jgi:hypothetical protein
MRWGRVDDAGTRGRGDAEMRERGKDGDIRHVSRVTCQLPPFVRHAAFIALMLFASTATSAKPTQQEVFRSIQDNVNETGTSGIKPILLICAGAGVLGLLALFGRRQQRQATPKALNHPGKLLKEIMKTVPLRPAELKQLKVVTEESAQASDGPLQSPLVLVLCPSVLAKAVQSRSTRADRRVLGQVLKKVVRSQHSGAA